MNGNLVTAARLLMGAIYTINGFNWWFKIITPYPSISDFATMAPPPDVVGAMIENGIMFHMVKALELLTGLALLGNFAVPLMLVAVLPITVSVCLVDVLFVATMRGWVMGAGSMILNAFLVLAYFGHYRTMLTFRAEPLTQDVARIDARPGLAALLEKPIAAALPFLGMLAIAAGVWMLAWLLMMIGQYIADPLPLSAVFPPRPA